MSTSLSLKPGDVIQNTYKVAEILGRGGMGATFKGQNIATGHSVAIKVMTAEFAENPKAMALFKRESSLLRTVQNDAVIRYETTLQDDVGRLFLIMEYVNGHPLAHFIKRGARLSSNDVLKLGQRLAGGLSAIHKLGIVHRDIAPDNVLIPEDDLLGAKFIDFGLASNTIGTEKTIIGDSVAGKFSYMAPEQLGLFGGKVTSATDIYALGLVLLRATGEKIPGEGMGAAALDERRKNIKLKQRNLSVPLRQVLEEMLKANPKDRPADLVGIFEKALKVDGPNSAKKRDTETVSEKPTNPKIIAALVACFLLIAGGGAYFFWGDVFTKAKTGKSLTQGEIAQDALKQDNPLSKIISLIDKGGNENLNAAFGALMKLGSDATQEENLRIRAFILIAEMYDPDNFNPNRSPFSRPNKNASRRIYQKASDLGSEKARLAVERLTE